MALAKELLQLEGVQFLLSERFTQDPLEEHFARQRRRRGCNDKTFQQFGQQELILNVMKSGMITELLGNTSGRQQGNRQIDVHDMRQLPKKVTLFRLSE